MQAGRSDNSPPARDQPMAIGTFHQRLLRPRYMLDICQKPFIPGSRSRSCLAREKLHSLGLNRSSDRA